MIGFITELLAASLWVGWNIGRLVASFKRTLT